MRNKAEHFGDHLFLVFVPSVLSSEAAVLALNRVALQVCKSSSYEVDLT